MVSKSKKKGSASQSSNTGKKTSPLKCLGVRKFNVSKSNGSKYVSFIQKYFTINGSKGRNRILKQGLRGIKCRLIVLLPKQSKDCFNYFDIELTAEGDDGVEVTIICRFDASSLYFIGFCSSENIWYFLDDWMPDEIKNWMPNEIENNNFFGDSRFEKLEASVSYEDMEKDVRRDSLQLGKKGLIEAVLALGKFKGKENPELKRHLLQIAQNFSEAIRFKDILNEIFSKYEYGARLNGRLLALQNKWVKSGKLCHKAIFNERKGEKTFDMSEEESKMSSSVSAIKPYDEDIYEARGDDLELKTDHRSQEV